VRLYHGDLTFGEISRPCQRLRDLTALCYLWSVRTKTKQRGTAHRKKTISVSSAAYQRMSERLSNVGGFIDKMIVDTLDDPRLAARVVDNIQRRALQ
jgi:hypothetical protein